MILGIWKTLNRRSGKRTTVILALLVVIAVISYANIIGFYLSKTEDDYGPVLDLPHLSEGQSLTPGAPVRAISGLLSHKDQIQNENNPSPIWNDVFPVGSEDAPRVVVEAPSMKAFEEGDLSYDGKPVGKTSWGKQDLSTPGSNPQHQRANATFFSLVRNDDLEGMMSAVMSVEERFNSRYHYDWVFANDQPFHPSFKDIISRLVSGKTHFVQIPTELWLYPDWIDQLRAEETRVKMLEKNIKYGGSESYRFMCRFNSGLFYRLEVMQQFKYYWRVEPDIKYACDLFEVDWFRYMRDNKKKYAFTMAPLELHTTVTGLWKVVKAFEADHPSLVAADNNMAFLTEDGGLTYNMCHFWSNFEIGDMDFYRLEAYERFFDHIDRSGGFFYSRWGDAPVHSIAVSLLLSKDSLHFLSNTGYYHAPNADCPRDPQIRLDRRCICLPQNDFTWLPGSCIPKFFEIHGFEEPPHVPQGAFKNSHKPAPEELDDLYDYRKIDYNDDKGESPGVGKMADEKKGGDVVEKS